MANAYNDGHSNDEELQAQQDIVHSAPDEKDKQEHSGNKPEPEEKDSKDTSKDSDTTKNGDKKPKSRWPLIILAIIVVLAIIAALVYWLMRRGLEDTDDAYTEGRAIAMAAMVSGYVTELNINDNTFVKAGDLLLKIDPRDYIAAREQARANLSLAQAQLESAEVDLAIARIRVPAQLVQAKAQLAQAAANQKQAAQEYHRQHTVDQRATTQTLVDQANAQFHSGSASVNSAQAQVDIASLVKLNIKAAEDTVKQKQAQVEQAKASLAQAEVNLSYTQIRAPQDGHITRRNIERGTYVQAGQQAFYIVTPDVWVMANFKENQLAGMHPGQSVSISVDAYPLLQLKGHVDSIQEGSGARFTAFPAENATGNFVKIVRRVPVKIMIDSGLDNRQGLPLGISVTPTVHVDE
jgi:membrane fusion protein (multidrug efflux system)